MREPISSHTRLLFLIALSACFFCSGQAESAVFTFKGVLTDFTSELREDGMIGPLPGPTFSPGDHFTGSAFVEDLGFRRLYGFNVSVNGFDFIGEGNLDPNPTGLTITAFAGDGGSNPFGLLDTFGELSLTFASGNGSFVLYGLSGNGGFGGTGAIGDFVISGDITSFPDGGSAALLLGAGLVCLAALRRILQPI